MDADGIEPYLTTFERMMKAYEVDPARWAYKLAPQLTGKAQQAYAALDQDEAQSYATVKAAILRRYNINSETYRQRFHSLKCKSGQTPLEIATRLTDLANKWLKDCSTAEEVKDAVVKEQLMSTLSDDVRAWVKERKPKTTAEAAQLVEDHMQAHPRVPVLDAVNMATGLASVQSVHGPKGRHSHGATDQDPSIPGLPNRQGMVRPNARTPPNQQQTTGWTG